MADRNVGARQAKPRPDSLKRRLLLVDNDWEDLLCYSEILRHQGYEVCSFTSFREGVTSLEQEVFDLVIVAQGSSKFEGHSVLERAIERDRHTPVLVLTHSIEIPCYIEAMQMGALDYLEKPSRPAELSKLVDKYLPSRSEHA